MSFDAPGRSNLPINPFHNEIAPMFRALQSHVPRSWKLATLQQTLLPRRVSEELWVAQTTAGGFAQ
jgi:hypothetical protein